MELLTSLILAVVTFFLGVIATAYGAGVGRALDTRKELLERMRDWIDSSLLRTNKAYQDAQGNNWIWAAESAESLVKDRLDRLVSSSRWFGVIESLDNKRLFDIAQEFTKLIFSFEVAYTEQVKQRGHPAEKFPKEVIDTLRSLHENIDDKAQEFHAEITKETLNPFEPRFLIGLLHSHSKKGMNVKVTSPARRRKRRLPTQR